jgi:hypothetical protein
MSLAEIKDAVRELSPKELAKLDFLFHEAERERAAGTLRDWHRQP